jgi:hypothetical protein
LETLQYTCCFGNISYSHVCMFYWRGWMSEHLRSGSLGCHSAPHWNAAIDEARPHERIRFFGQNRSITIRADHDPLHHGNLSRVTGVCTISGRDQEFDADLQTGSQRSANPRRCPILRCHYAQRGHSCPCDRPIMAAELLYERPDTALATFWPDRLVLSEVAQV